MKKRNQNPEKPKSELKSFYQGDLIKHRLTSEKAIVIRFQPGQCVEARLSWTGPTDNNMIIAYECEVELVEGGPERHRVEAEHKEYEKAVKDNAKPVVKLKHPKVGARDGSESR